MNRFGEWLDDILNRSVPNDFTIGMGKLIREARKENNLSQEELAEAVYKRRASLSDFENGKMIVDTITLTLLARVLNKPLSYFFPAKYKTHLPAEQLTEEQQALLMDFERITDPTQRKIALSQIRALADLDL